VSQSLQARRNRQKATGKNGTDKNGTDKKVGLQTNLAILKLSDESGASGMRKKRIFRL
jgi:hypothetical protein